MNGFKKMAENNTGLKKLSDAFISLYNLVGVLRAPDGCPWDREQTCQSIRMYILEEAYEVISAVERDDFKGLCEELGDLLFMILFMVRIAEENDEFALIDVIMKIKDKMIKRHPHVFGDKRFASPDEVMENWRRIKKKERKNKEDIDNGLMAMSGLMMAQRMLRRFEDSEDGCLRNKQEIIENMKETIGRVEQMDSNEREKIGELIGDLLFNIVELARKNRVNAEDQLRMKIYKASSLR